MKTSYKLRRLLVALLAGWVALAPARAAFVYETPKEFLTTGDFNGDGVADVVVLDKLTGNARVGYGASDGSFAWSVSLATGIQNVSGCAAGRFPLTTRDALAVTAADYNRVNLFDCSGTNTITLLRSIGAVGIGPHGLAALSAPFGAPPPSLNALLVASAYNVDPEERLDLVTSFPIGNGVSAGQYSESSPLDRLNALPLGVGGPTFALGLARGTNDDLHLWQFTNSPAVLLTLSNLPAGSDYVFGWFNAESLPRFAFYVPGQSNLTLRPLVLSGGGLAFGTATTAALTEAVQRVFYTDLGTDGALLIQFGDGVQGARLPAGSLALGTKYQTGLGSAGNVPTGMVPLGAGRFMLLSAPTGSVFSVHSQVLRFDGAGYTQLSTGDLPAVTSRSTRANLWLFQTEPFVHRSPGFIASKSSPDWTDQVLGLPGALSVQTEADGGPASGLNGFTTNSLGAPPAGTAFALANQVHSAISVFTYSSPQAADPVTIAISPPPGIYPGPIQVSFTVTGSGAAYYRVGDAAPWQVYSASFTLTNDATVQFYGAALLTQSRSRLQFASYTLGVSGATPPDPFNPNPGNTNPPPVLGTNTVVLSANGTIFYGRRSPTNAGSIWAINLDGSGDTFITAGVRPRVTPDGRWMAFLRDGSPFPGRGNIWLRELATGYERLLFSNPDYVICYDWEPDAATLLTDYNCGIWTLNRDGGLTAVIASDCYDDAPVRNPADGSIAFHNLNPTASIAGLYVAAASGSGRQRIVSTVGGASWPSWSPDGNRLAFADNNNYFTIDGGRNLYVVNPDGTGLSQISGFTDPTNGFPHGAIWSPDGSALVGAGMVFGTNGLWVIPLTPSRDDCDGPPILLPTTPGDAIDFAGSIVSAAVPAGVVQPGLFVRRDPAGVVVYWSQAYRGFTLEYASDLNASAIWTAIPGPYGFDGYFYQHTEPWPSLAFKRYFRLHYTGSPP